MAVVKSRQQLRITGSTVCLAVSRLCVQEGPSTDALASCLRCTQASPCLQILALIDR